MKAALITGVHPYAFRSGESAVITGVEWIKPAGYGWRLCYRIVFPDGKSDTVPLSEVENGNYVITKQVSIKSNS